MPLAVAEVDSRCGKWENLVLISSRVLSGGETEISSRTRLPVTGGVASWPTLLENEHIYPASRGSIAQAPINGTEEYRAASQLTSRLAEACVAYFEVLQWTTMDGMRDPAEKLLSPDQVGAWLTAERAEGRKIGFSCGSFDLLHPGHVQYLHLARQRCDRLLVAVNSDASVRRYKSPLRPINPERERMYVVAALESVDVVTLLDA